MKGWKHVSLKRWLVPLVAPLLLALPSAAQFVTGPPTNLTPTSVTDDYVSRISKDGSRITWLATRGEIDYSYESYNVMYANSDGSGQARARFWFDTGSVSDLQDNKQDEWPSLNGDGSKLVLHCWTTDWATTDILLLDLNTGTPTQLTKNTEMDSYPAISPDGTMVAFASKRYPSSGYQLWVMKAEPESGTNVPVQLTNWTDSEVERASWTPDGKILLGRNYGDGNLDICRVDPKDSNGDGEGDNMTVLYVGGYVTDPTQAVVGGPIFFLKGAADGKNHVFRMNADGTNVYQVTGGPFAEDYPCVANGKLLVSYLDVKNNGAGNWDVAVYNLTDATGNGTVTGKLTTSVGAPAVGSTVTALNGDNVIATTTTGAGGTYTLDLPAGGYTIRYETEGAYTVTRSLVVPVGGTVIQDAFTTPTVARRPLNVVPTIKETGTGLQVSVRWNGEPGVVNLGYNVWKGTTENGPWTKINTSIIPVDTSGGSNYEFVDTTPGDLTKAFYTVTSATDDGGTTVESAFADAGQAACNIAPNPSFENYRSWDAGDPPQNWELSWWSGSDWVLGTTTDDKVDGTRSAYIKTGDPAGTGIIQTDWAHHPIIEGGKAYIQSTSVRHLDGGAGGNYYLPCYLNGIPPWAGPDWYPWDGDYAMWGAGTDPWSMMANTNPLRMYEFSDMVRMTYMWDATVPGGSRILYDEVRFQRHRLDGEGIIQGRIQESWANPIAGVTISANGKSVTTEPYRGIFALHAPDGMVELTISIPDHEPTKITVPNYGGYRLPSDFTLWEHLPLVVHGHVTLPNGDPAPGAKVRVLVGGTDEIVVTADANGFYTTKDSGIDAASWSESGVEATLDGYAPAYFQGGLGLAGWANIDLKLGDELGFFQIAQTQGPITIDGVLNPSEWNPSQTIDLLKGYNGAPWPQAPTKAYALWDEVNLYLAFASEEPNPAGMRAVATGHDNSAIWYTGSSFNADDVFEVWLGPTRSVLGYGNEQWQIMTNSNTSNPSWADIAWRQAGPFLWGLEYDIQGFTFKSRVDTVGKMWYTEMKIPFAEMSVGMWYAGVTPSVGDKWLMNLSRGRHQPEPDGGGASTGFSIATFVTTLTGVKGDINGDGLVTPLDAIHALRIAGGLEGIITRKAQGDVNVDGKVDITDATMILRKTDGLAGF